MLELSTRHHRNAARHMAIHKRDDLPPRDRLQRQVAEVRDQEAFKVAGNCPCLGVACATCRSDKVPLPPQRCWRSAPRLPSSVPSAPLVDRRLLPAMPAVPASPCRRQRHRRIFADPQPRGVLAAVPALEDVKRLAPVVADPHHQAGDGNVRDLVPLAGRCRSQAPPTPCLSRFFLFMWPTLRFWATLCSGLAMRAHASV